MNQVLRKQLLMLPIFLGMTGCHTLQKIYKAESEPLQIQRTPDDYTVNGVTIVDFQIINPIRCQESLVTVKIKTLGMTTFRDLNQYEFACDAAAGSVRFKKEVQILPGGNLLLTGRPVAPAGTEYRIRSVRMDDSHSLY